MKRFEKHIFVCENIRPADHPRGSCGNRGSSSIREELKTMVRDAGLASTVRVNSAGCLDACEFGPVMVVYPETIWYGKVSRNDLSEILEQHIKNNIPVRRLIIEDKRFNQGSD